MVYRHFLHQDTVSSCRLKELKDYPSNNTWFKHHLKVLSDLMENSTLLLFQTLPPWPRLFLLPVVAATVEMSFSGIKLVKTRLRSQLGCDTLEDQALRVCIEGPERLTDECLEAIIEHWKEQKTCRLIVYHKTSKTFLFYSIFFGKSTIYI